MRGLPYIHQIKKKWLLLRKILAKSISSNANQNQKVKLTLKKQNIIIQTKANKN
jgi:uncharacterized membrane-anchored protein